MITPSSRDECGLGVFGIFNVLLFVSVIVAGLVAFMQITPANPLSPAFLEKEPPEIAWIEEPLGIGADPITLKARITDSGAGLDEILVRISQKNQPQELLKRQIREGNVHEQEIEVKIDPKALQLREGNAELQILAFDRTLWNNGSGLPKTVQVDFLKPRIEVITPEQNAVAGGTEMVFYKALGKSIHLQGVDSGDNLYRGYPAAAWGESFKSYERVYFAFFPIPSGFNDQSPPLKIVARDLIGNSASAPFRYRVRQKRGASFKVNLNDASAGMLRDRFTAYARASSLSVALSGELASDLKTLLRDIARRDEAVLEEALSASESKRWWNGPFGKPVAGYPSNSVGDKRLIAVNDREIASSAAQGARFAVSARATVVAAQAGRVVLVANLGLLGTTVVIDHGCGLATVYAHLSETTVTQGSEVATGQAIGRTGSTGFATSEEVYFEMRVQGVAVSPNEWWDQNWVRDHIENKVSFVQRTLVGASGE
jgi:murein DD-endopeptidase MepM/ murein hydrolase activator NlpD